MGRELEGSFSGGLVLAWLSPFGFFLVWRSRGDRRQDSSPGMFPLNIHTSSVNTPTMTPTVVTTDLRTTSNAGPTQQTLNDCHAGVRPGPDRAIQRDGGCRDLGPAEYLKSVMAVIPGPSKRPPATLNPNSA